MPLLPSGSCHESLAVPSSEFPEELSPPTDTVH